MGPIHSLDFIQVHPHKVRPESSWARSFPLSEVKAPARGIIPKEESLTVLRMRDLLTHANPFTRHIAFLFTVYNRELP